MCSVKRSLKAVVAVDSEGMVGKGLKGTIVERDPEGMVCKRGLEETIARRDSREKVQSLY
jgi:hypothetical protein